MNFRLIRFHNKANVKKIKHFSREVGSRDKSLVKGTFKLFFFFFKKIACLLFLSVLLHYKEMNKSKDVSLMLNLVLHTLTLYIQSPRCHIYSPSPEATVCEGFSFVLKDCQNVHDYVYDFRAKKVSIYLWWWVSILKAKRNQNEL